MIYDLLTHIGVRKGENYKIESLLELDKKAGIDRTMICSQLETIDNEYIYDCTKRYPTETLGFAVLNPWDIGAEENLEKYYREYGFYGLKMNAIRYGYSADRTSLLGPFFDICRSYKRIVVAHCQSDLFSIPDKWAYQARQFPDVPFVLFHIGIPFMAERCCELAKELPNVYVSTCAAFVPVMKMAYEVCGPEKMIFSSDAPFGDPCQELEKIQYVIKNPEHLEMILYGNAKRIMNL